MSPGHPTPPRSAVTERTVGSMRIRLIQPPPRGLVSGGYQFNTQLGRVLEEDQLGGVVETGQLQAIEAQSGDVLLLDSLFLGRAAPIAFLQGLNQRGLRLFLLAHYLPLENPVAPEKEKLAWRRAASRWMPFFEGILSTGKRACPLWQKHFPSAPARHFLPPAIGEAPVPPPAERTGSSPLRIVTVGALSPNKNQAFILDSLRALPALDFRWDLVGSLDTDPAYADRFMRKARQYGLIHRIHRHGCLSPEKCHSLISRADAYVTASLFENFGMATAEALARGRPVLSFEVGDILEWLPPEAAYRIPKVGDSAGFQAALQAVLTAPSPLPEQTFRPSFPAREWTRTAQILKTLLEDQR